ncbi:MAG: phospholipase D-like domain-containing protein, partial [Arenimonas sp.]
MDGSVRPTRRAGPWHVYTEGDLLYDAMLADLNAAGRSIRIESYIIASDAVGQPFVEALCAAARRGLRVRLRADHAGSYFSLSGQDIDALRQAGVDFQWSRRWSIRHPLTFNRRNHRKLAIIDDGIAYLGGFNLHAASSLRIHGIARWRDTHVRLTGKLAVAAAAIFDAAGLGAQLRAATELTVGAASLVPSSAGPSRHAWRRALRAAMRRARARIWVTTPYFVPDRSLRRDLHRAARAGVDVRLLLPAKTDVALTQWAARAAYARLLASGVRIFEYTPRVLHSKTIVIDAGWAAIGSANLDYRSMFVNDEITLTSSDGKLNRVLSQN